MFMRDFSVVFSRLLKKVFVVAAGILIARSLGTYTFEAGESGSVLLKASGDGAVVTDALSGLVRLATTMGLG